MKASEGIDPMTPEVAAQLARMTEVLMVVGVLLLTLMGLVYIASRYVNSPIRRTGLWLAVICGFLVPAIVVVGLLLAGIFTRQ